MKQDQSKTEGGAAVRSSELLAVNDADARRKKAVRLLKKARRIADAQSTLTGDYEVALIYDLLDEAIGILNPKKQWDFGGEVINAANGESSDLRD